MSYRAGAMCPEGAANRGRASLLADEVHPAVVMDHELVGDRLGEGAVRRSEVGDEVVLLRERPSVEIADVRWTVDRHCPGHEVMITPSEVVHALVLGRRHGHDGLDPRAVGPIVGDRDGGQRDGEERSTNRTHRTTVRRGIASHKPTLTLPDESSRRGVRPTASPHGVA